MTIELEVPQEHPVFDLMRRGVPLTLLVDLAVPCSSSTVLRDEPGDATWLPVARTA